MPPDSTRALLEAQPYMSRLQALTDELRLVRKKVEPIWKYYFPDSLLVNVAIGLRLAKRPDRSRYRVELQTLRDQCWRLIKDADAALRAIGATGIELKFKQLAQLAFQQIEADGDVIILLNEWTNAEDPKDALAYFAGMKQMSDKARANLLQMQALGERIRREEGA